MRKEVQMSVKLDAVLRHDFMQAAETVDRPAAQILREMMRVFVMQHKNPNAETIQAMQDVEAGNVTTYQNADDLYRKLGLNVNQEHTRNK